MKQTRLYSPDGRMSRTVVDRGRLWKTLVRGGWSSAPPASTPPQEGPEPAHLGTSVTASMARADLERRSPADWAAEWGPVLCAALDETEAERKKLAARMPSLTAIAIAAIDGFQELSQASVDWMKICGVPSGAGLDPSPARQRASEALWTAVRGGVTAFRHQMASFFDAAFPQGAGRVPSGVSTSLASPDFSAAERLVALGDPASRAAASQILADLQDQLGLAPDEPLAEKIAALRARLGGSNVPLRPGEGEEPS